MKSTSLRLPEDLLAATRELAARRNRSVNAIVVESIANTLKVEEEAALYDAFTLLGQDDDSSVEFAVDAQAEVVARGEL